jgi:hypothetical protein
MIEPDLRCVEFVELVTDWSEGALDHRTVSRFEEHLAFCTGCGEYVVQLRQTASVLEGLDAEGPSPSARDELLRAFRSRPRA